MRILNNNKGSLLVILVICMTLIAVLGASFVSMVGSKQQGFVSLLNGQQANMAAKAGVEWAILYASTGLDAGGKSIFISNPNLTFTKTLDTNVTFSTSYNYSTDILTVDGTYQGVTETITLSNFRKYLGYITIDPSKTPAYRGNRRFIDVPVNVNGTVSVSSISIRMNMSYTYLVSITDPAGTKFFDAEAWWFYYPKVCYDYPAPGPPCAYPGYAVELPTGTATFSNTGMRTIASNTVNFSQGNYVFEFYYPYYGTPPQQIVTFNFSNGAKSELRFFGP